MSLSISAAAATATAPYLYKKSPEQTTQAEKNDSGVVADVILVDIIGLVLIYYAATYIYGTIRYKV